MARTLRTPAVASLLFLLLPLAAPLATADDPLPPSAPLALAAVFDEASRDVLLSWQPPADDGGAPVDQYVVLLSFDGGSSYGWLGAVAGDVVAFTDTEFNLGPAYTYAVRAVNAAGEGALSDTVTVQEVRAPTAPQNVAAELIDQHRIHVQWSLPEEMGGSPLDGFRLYRGLDGAEPTFYLTSYGLEYYDGIEGGHTYVYQVSAVNGVGEGPRSAPVSVSSGPGAPSAPLDLQVVVDQEAQDAILTWQPPADDGGSAIVQYDVIMTIDGTGPMWAGAVAGDVLTFTHADFQFGPAYTYFVQASNGFAQGPPSDGATVQDTSVPSAPRWLTAGPENWYMRVEWFPPETSGGHPVTEYRVYRAIAGQEPALHWVTDGAAFFDTADDGRTYVYEVSAVNALGEGPRAGPVTATAFPGPPHAPLDFVATPDGASGEVLLTWQAPEWDGGAAITHYRLMRSGPDGTVFIDTDGLVLEHTDSGLAYSQQYSYILQAVNEHGPGHGAGPVAVVLNAAPSVPRDVAVEVGATCIRLTWSVPEQTGGETVWEYPIYRATGNGPSVRYATGDVFREFLDCSLEGLTTYRYEVSAVNSQGEGSRSAAVRADTSPQPPKATTGLSAVAEQGYVHLAWTPAENTPANPVDHQWVARTSPGQSGWWLLDQLPAAAFAWTDGSVLPGQAYTYRVFASSQYGSGEPAYADVTTPEAPPVFPPSAPLGLAVQGVPEFMEVHLSWQPPASDGGAPVTGYVVERSGPDGTFESPATQFEGPTSSHAWVDPGETYTFRVRAANDAGSGPWSEPVSIRLTTVPSVPLSFSAYLGGACVIVQWEAPESDGGEPVLGYRIHRGVGDEPLALHGGIDGPASSYVDCNLEAFTAYRYAVLAFNAVGEGPLTEPMAVETGVMPPAPATGLTATPARGPKVVLGWTPPASTPSNPVDGLLVVRSEPGQEGYWGLASLPADATGYVDWTAVVGETYTYGVYAHNQVDTSYAYVQVEVPADLPAPTVPGEPRDLVATSGPGLGEVSLSWDAPSDDGGHDIYVYWVYADPEGPATEFLVGSVQPGAGPLGFVDTGLVTGETRTYRVSATNLLGEGPKSAPVAGSAFDTPSAPLAVDADPALFGAAVSWQAPADDGGLPLLTYTVYRSVAGGGPTWVATVDASTTAVTDPDCTLLQACRYHVAASNLAGQGDASDGAWTRGLGLPRALG